MKVILEKSITLLVPCLIITKEFLKNQTSCDNDDNNDKENDDNDETPQEKSDKKGKNKTIKLPCTDNCKQLTDFEKKTIVELKAAFSKDVDDFRQILQDIYRQWLPSQARG